MCKVCIVLLGTCMVIVYLGVLIFITCLYVPMCFNYPCPYAFGVSVDKRHSFSTCIRYRHDDGQHS